MWFLGGGLGTFFGLTAFIECDRFGAGGGTGADNVSDDFVCVAGISGVAGVVAAVIFPAKVQKILVFFRNFRNF